MKTPCIEFVDVGKAEFHETQLPDTPAPGRLLLKTEVTLISPGTEFACLSNQTNQSSFHFPAMLGYSAVATVWKTGAGVTKFREGDRCLCYHSVHRAVQDMPEDLLVRIEDNDLPSEEAVFCVVGAMGFQGIRRCRPEFGEAAMVMGLGLLGQFAVQTARLCGCFPVIGLDYNEARRNIAQKNGADAVFSPDDPELEKKIRERTHGRGVDLLAEITGNPQALIQGLKLTAPGGRVSLVGCSRTPTEKIDFYNLVHRPGIAILGAHNMARPLHDARPGIWTMREDMTVLLRSMALGRLRSRDLITQIADPAEAPGIYDRLYRRDPTLLGVVFDWKKYLEGSLENGNHEISL